MLLVFCVASSVPDRPAAWARALPSPTAGLTEFRSSGGLLAVTLLAEAGKVRIGDLDLDGATYNGLYAGPVLRVRPGDMLRIQLINHLSQPTNLHFHGIFTSPLGYSDNIHLSVAPGDTFTYQVRIPKTQPPGLYWYHSHIHGISEQQVMNGLSGALVVEPPADPALTERLFVLKDMSFDDDTGNATVDDELHGLVQSINGDLDTDTAMHPGETQLWRFTNQSANRPFHIALQGHRFRIVARDGEPTSDEREVDVLDIMPSSRFDVLVEGGPSGRYELISKGAMTGTGAARRLDRVLGILAVGGEPAVPADLSPPAPLPPDLSPVRIDARRTVVFTQTKTTKPDEQIFYVNGVVFDAKRVDMRIPLGNVEEWTVRNDTDDLHVFHIHQLGFQVTEINGEPLPFTGRVDTVRVPERGELKLRMAFTDKTILGQFVFHCHVLRHEDKGMMAQIEIYDPRPTDFAQWVRRLGFHLWWWAHGVPWSLCGLDSA
jgi:FtsP/CotA-like multicopper oxidase with cupredoxin domain